MRSKTISYRRKQDITSREGKGERKNREEHTVKAMPVTESFSVCHRLRENLNVISNHLLNMQIKVDLSFY